MDSVVTRKLKSKDGKVFEVEDKYLQNSKFLMELIKDFPDNQEELNITEVTGATLSKVIEYLKHYEIEKPKEIPKPLPNSDLKPILLKWDYDYITALSLEEIIDVINAANFLNIPELVNLASVRIASELTNCPVEEARIKFGIINDMNEEEMKEINKYPLD